MSRTVAERRGRLDGRSVVDAIVLGAAVVAGWYLVVPVAHAVLGPEDADAEIGGMWSIVATAFVFSDRVRDSGHSFSGRMLATVVSSGLCAVYLLLLPVSIWGIALVIGLGAVALAVAGLQAETVTTSITTAVVLVVAGIDGPGSGWEDPIIRIIATAVGGLVGFAAAWAATAVRRWVVLPG